MLRLSSSVVLLHTFMPASLVLKYLPHSSHRYLWQRINSRDALPWMEILRIVRQNESLMRSFSPAQCGHVFLPVHLASKTGGVRLTTFSIAKSRKPIKNCSTGPSLLFFGRKIKVALVGIPALLGMPIFSWSRYAPVFEVEPFFAKIITKISPQFICPISIQ